jgi:prepilin-type N-terminal cleavage/methylation domain-containing protein
MRRQTDGTRKGFTLVELLVVVGIIGLLSSVTLVGLGSFRARGRDARRIADLREVQNALELFYTANQQYPATSGSTADGTAWTNMVSAITGAGVGVGSLPTGGPAPNTVYNYGSDSGGQSYVLQSTLEDPNNPALNNDLDVTTFGVSCAAATEYCIRF